MKKIHILANCYWGDGMSGGDRRLIEIVKRWKFENRDNTAERYELIVYTVKKFAKLMLSEGVNHCKYVITDSNCKKSDGLIISYLKRTSNCNKLLAQRVNDGDIIYSPTDILPDIIPAYKAKKKYGVDVRWVMITYHIFEDFYKRPGNIIRNFISCTQQKMAISYGMNKADIYLTTSPLVYEYFEKRKYNLSKVSIVDNAVDTTLVENSNKEKQGYDAIFMARLNNSKGVLELPLIWRYVIKEYPNAKLGIIGKGLPDMIDKLKGKIRDCNCENNIDMLGFLDSSDAYSIMKKSKVFLFTSHEEGWGMALAEAQLCGLPVVAYELPIFSKLFKGLSLCPFLDVKAMARAVCLYLKDEEKRSSDANIGRKHILNSYSLDAVARKEYEILTSKKIRMQ